MTYESRLQRLEQRQSPRRIKVVWPIGDEACPRGVQNEPIEEGDVVIYVRYEDVRRDDAEY